MSIEKLNQIRESISDAVLALSQLGDDASHLSTLIAQERLARLSSLELAVLSGGAQNDDERPYLRQELLGCMDFLAGLAKSDISANKMRDMARNEHDHLSSVVANRDDNEERLKIRSELESLRMQNTLLKMAGAPKQHCNVATEITIEQDPHPFSGKRTGNRRLTVKLENGSEVIYKIKDDDGSQEPNVPQPSKPITR